LKHDSSLITLQISLAGEHPDGARQRRTSHSRANMFEVCSGADFTGDQNPAAAVGIDVAGPSSDTHSVTLRELLERAAASPVVHFAATRPALAKHSRRRTGCHRSDDVPEPNPWVMAERPAASSAARKQARRP
jgi:hypothetical protein